MGEPIYGDTPQVPTMVVPGHEHVHYDFNDGLRVLIDKDAPHPYRVRFYDAPSGVQCHDQLVEPGTIVTSNKKYYVKWRLLITHEDGLVLDHTLDLSGRHVLVQCPGIKSAAIGDTVAMVCSIRKFAIVHDGASVSVAMNTTLSRLFSTPLVEFLPHAETLNTDWYATYRLGLFWHDEEHDKCPVDHRLAGNFRAYAYILGVQDCGLPEEPPRLEYPVERTIPEPYVCIGVQASSACKMWMGDNFRGWANLVRWLKSTGRRVLCIDKEPCTASGTFHMEIPHDAEDYTGDRPLAERLQLLRHADCYVGGSSGLSWLAWCAGCPVVMISGFTEDWNEFPTPYRVRLRMSCSGCWNDVRHEFDHKSMLWCPRHMDEEARRFECSRLVTSRLVIDTIRQIPAFADTQGAP